MARRSRLEAIAQSVNVAERLRKSKISFVTTNCDVANAHPSSSHAALSETLEDTLQDDTGLLKQRHELAMMEIQGADENILIRPCSGTAQGREGAADASHWVNHESTDRWPDHLQAEPLQDAFLFKSPPTTPDIHLNSSVNVTLTTCAGDVRATSIITEPCHSLTRVTDNNTALDDALLDMAQNTALQEHSVFFAGQHAGQRMAFLPQRYRVLPGSIALVGYLGPHFDIMGSIRPELERRPVLYTGLEALRLRLRPPDYEYFLAWGER